MKYNNRQEFINDSSSEKITLAFVYPAQRLMVWHDDGSNKWSKTVDFVVDQVKKGDTYLISVANAGLVNANTKYFYDITANLLHIYTTSDTPDSDNIIVFYKLCFSNKPLRISHNLLNDSNIVDFEARIKSNPGFKSMLSVDNISLVNGGNLSLENNDGYFNTIYKSLIWESKLVEIFSYSDEMDIEETKIIYRGFVENKTFTLTEFTLAVKDIQRQLEEKVNLKVYDSTIDHTDPKFDGTFKRTIYGKVKGLECKNADFWENKNYFNIHPFSVDAMVNNNPWAVDFNLKHVLPNNIWAVKRSGVLFKYQSNVQQIPAPPGYSISYGFKTETNIGLIDLPPGTHSYTYSNELGIPVTVMCYSPGELEIIAYSDNDYETYISQLNENRKWIISGDTISYPTTIITLQNQLDRFFVENTTGFNEGDRVEVNGYTYTIAQVSGLMIRTTINSQTGYNTGLTVKRIPVLSISHNNKIIPLTEIKDIEAKAYFYNSSNFTLSRKAELMAINEIPKLISVSLIDHSNLLVFDATDSFRNELMTKNIKPGCLIGLNVSLKQNLVLVTKVYADFKYRIGTAFEKKSFVVEFIPISEDFNYGLWNSALTDNTLLTWNIYNSYSIIKQDDVLVVDSYGKTFGYETDSMINTGADIIYDLINNSSKMGDFIEKPSFDAASLENPYPLSIVIPSDSSDKKRPSIKEVVNKINKTIKTSLALDNNLNLVLNSLMSFRDVDQVIINDDDLISWSVSCKSNDLYSDIIVSYDFRDYNIDLKEKGNLTLEKENEYVKEFEISGNTLEVDLYSNDLEDTTELMERILFSKSLSETVIKMKGSFALVDLEIGQQVVLNVSKLFLNQYGDKKINGMVTSITRTGDTVDIEISDLGNLFDRIAVIADDSTDSYIIDNNDTRINSSYITDENGLVEGDIITINTNIIG